MKKLIAGLIFATLGLASPAMAQRITMPPPAGVVIMGCVYNTTPPTLTTGQIGYVQCSNQGALSGGGGGSGGLSVVDQTAFVAGTSAFTPSGGVFNDTATLTSGQEGTYRLTAQRAQIVDVDAAGGNNKLANLINSPPNLSVNAAVQAWTGITPGGSRTGTVYGGDVNISSVNGTASAAFVTGGATIANSLSTFQNTQYPVNSVTTAPAPITAHATGTTGAVVGTLAAATTATTYVCGFDVSAVGGTAAVGPVTVAGLTGGSFTYQMNSAATPVLLSREFSPCIPASAVNTVITVTTTADGTATAVDVNMHGYQL